jgi:TonB family protein
MMRSLSLLQIVHPINFVPYLVGILIVWSGCAGPKSNPKLLEGSYPDGKQKFHVEVDSEGKKQGQEIWWYPNGNKKYEAINSAGFRSGPFKAWYLDGQPWYSGEERQGRLDGELKYFHPNGELKSRALFRDGIRLEREDFSPQGDRTQASHKILAEEIKEAEAKEKVEQERRKKEATELWAQRVRATVESYWVLPKELKRQGGNRSIVSLEVERNGKLSRIQWIKRSNSASFNSFAEKAIKKVKRLPPIPQELEDNTLTIQYEFVTQTRPSKTKLQLRGSPPDEEDDEFQIPEETDE